MSRALKPRRNLESKDIALCANCELFVPVEMVECHSFQCELTRLNGQPTEINKKLRQVSNICMSHTHQISSHKIKHRLMRRLADICLLINQLDFISDSSMRIYQIVDQELAILQRLSDHSFSLELLVGRVTNLMDEKLELLTSRACPPYPPSIKIGSPAKQNASVPNQLQLCEQNHALSSQRTLYSSVCKD